MKCRNCGNELTEENFKNRNLRKKNYICNNCELAYAKEWRKNHREQCRENSKHWKENFIEKYGLEKWKERERKIGAKSRMKHKKEAIERTKKWKKELAIEVLTHYSNGTMKCACKKCYYSDHDCPIEFLTLDHINNDGAEQRKQLFGGRQGGARFYYWLKKNNFPEGFQVLCWNCNCGKIRNNGVCPHLRGK